MEKVRRNDPCPCGSGKKYKNCCGRTKVDNTKDVVNTSDLVLEDFVIERLSEDVRFLESALQFVIGPHGYYFCEKNKDSIITSRREYAKEAVNNNALLIQERADYYGVQLSDIIPYEGFVDGENQDILSMIKDGIISLDGCQVEIFHEYLMNNLKKRFVDYFYLPTKEKARKQNISHFTRRGYDFLLAITLYLELQLGIHIYFGNYSEGEMEMTQREFAASFYGYQYKSLFTGRLYEKLDITLRNGYVRLLYDYASLLNTLSEEYDAGNDLDVYFNNEVLDEDQYKKRKRQIDPAYYAGYIKYDYIGYLKRIILATIFNSDDEYELAVTSFPQCDYIKYHFGLEDIIDLFENSANGSRRYIKLNGSSEIMEKVCSRKYFYHETVFLWTDEINGTLNPLMPSKLEYIDFPEDINSDENTAIDGIARINPARRTTRAFPFRKLRMELYNLLNGKTFSLYYGDTDSPLVDWNCIGRYPILPWIGNGTEKMIHISVSDNPQAEVRQLFSLDIKKRQEFLNMEYRLTSIPANCVATYLEPEFFYNLEKRNELQKRTAEQNQELKRVNMELAKANESLKRHMQLNQELVRNLSHSSVNYLNSEKLNETGVNLHRADKETIEVKNLHDDGLFLMLQSEQEMFLSRSLNSLVWRCSADMGSLIDQIKSGASDKGISVVASVEFAMKMVLSRVLFRDGDRRAEFIRKKIESEDGDVLHMKSDFILDILAEKNLCDGKVTEWWQNNISDITVDLSRFWDNVRIIKDGSLYDLITEIVSEQLLNGLSHGDITSGIHFTFGHEEFLGEPEWAYISCKNKVGNKYKGGKGIGLSGLNEMMMLINNDEKGAEVNQYNNWFDVKVWINPFLLKPKEIEENEVDYEYYKKNSLDRR